MKRKAWKVVLGLAVGVFLSFGGVYWNAHHRATEIFRHYEVRATQSIAALRSHSRPRALICSPSTPGDGWAPYLAALAGFEAIPDAEADEIPIVNMQPDFEPDFETLEDLFQKYDPLVEQLRESNRRSGFRPAYESEVGLDVLVANIGGAMRTARFLSARATHFHDSGRRPEALESLLLGMSMGQDTGRGGMLVHNNFQVFAENVETECLRALLKEHDFRAPELEEFAAGLDRLRKSRPEFGDALDLEEAILGRSFSEFGLGSGAARPAKDSTFGRWHGHSWRYLYSRRLAAAGALGEIDLYYAEARRRMALPMELRVDALQGLFQERPSRNPLSESMCPDLGRLCRRDTLAQMSLTLMRVAVAIAWYDREKGVPPAALKDLVPRYIPDVPLCPLTGMPLGYRPGAVWSPGLNRVDDGGVPGRNDDGEDPDGDVVWVVKRRK